MKAINILVLSLLLIGSCATNKKQNQNTEKIVRVVYDSQTSFEIDKSDSAPTIEAYQKAMEEVHNYELLTNSEKSNFNYIEKVDNNQDEDSGGVQITFAAPMKIFKNLNKKTYLLAVNVTGDDLLLKDEIPVYNWKISSEKKNILGYPVSKAVAITDSIDLTAWFTPKIPIKSGPYIYGDLPGLILKLKSESK